MDFEKLNKNAIWKVLKIYGIPETILRTIEFIFEGYTTIIDKYKKIKVCNDDYKKSYRYNLKYMEYKTIIK